MKEHTSMNALFEVLKQNSRNDPHTIKLETLATKGLAAALSGTGLRSLQQRAKLSPSFLKKLSDTLNTIQQEQRIRLKAACFSNKQAPMPAAGKNGMLGLGLFDQLALAALDAYTWVCISSNGTNKTDGEEYMKLDTSRKHSEPNGDRLKGVPPDAHVPATFVELWEVFKRDPEGVKGVLRSRVPFFDAAPGHSDMESAFDCLPEDLQDALVTLLLYHLISIDCQGTTCLSFAVGKALLRVMQHYTDGCMEVVDVADACIIASSRLNTARLRLGAASSCGSDGSGGSSSSSSSCEFTVVIAPQPTENRYCGSDSTVEVCSRLGLQVAYAATYLFTKGGIPDDYEQLVQQLARALVDLMAGRKPDYLTPKTLLQEQLQAAAAQASLVPPTGGGCSNSCARIKLSESHLDSSKSYFRLGACSTPDLQKVFAGDLPAAAGTAFHFVAVLQGSSGGGGGTVLGVPMSVMREADQDRLKVSVGVPQLHAFVIQQLAQLGATSGDLDITRHKNAAGDWETAGGFAVLRMHVAEGGDFTANPPLDNTPEEADSDSVKPWSKVLSATDLAPKKQVNLGKPDSVLLQLLPELEHREVGSKHGVELMLDLQLSSSSAAAAVGTAAAAEAGGSSATLPLLRMKARKVKNGSYELGGNQEGLRERCCTLVGGQQCLEDALRRQAVVLSLTRLRFGGQWEVHSGSKLPVLRGTLHVSGSSSRSREPAAASPAAASGAAASGSAVPPRSRSAAGNRAAGSWQSSSTTAAGAKAAGVKRSAAAAAARSDSSSGGQHRNSKAQKLAARSSAAAAAADMRVGRVPSVADSLAAAADAAAALAAALAAARAKAAAAAAPGSSGSGGRAPLYPPQPGTAVLFGAGSGPHCWRQYPVVLVSPVVLAAPVGGSTQPSSSSGSSRICSSGSNQPVMQQSGPAAAAAAASAGAMSSQSRSKQQQAASPRAGAAAAASSAPAAPAGGGGFVVQPRQQQAEVIDLCNSPCSSPRSSSVEVIDLC